MTALLIYVNVHFILRSFILVFALFWNKMTMRDRAGFDVVIGDFCIPLCSLFVFLSQLFAVLGKLLVKSSDIISYSAIN